MLVDKEIFMTTIPSIVQQYLDAENAHDPEAMAACFAPDGIVEDGETLTGNAAILEWARRVVTAYNPSSVLKDATQEGDTTQASVRISGTFDGSPLDFRLTFRVRAGRIAGYRAELA